MTKAILLLHGFATNKTDFDPIIDELNNLYDHVECHNLPGHILSCMSGLMPLLILIASYWWLLNYHLISFIIYREDV